MKTQNIFFKVTISGLAVEYMAKDKKDFIIKVAEIMKTNKGKRVTVSQVRVSPVVNITTNGRTTIVNKVA